MSGVHLPALLAEFPLSACATLETGADLARDFVVAHPIVTAIAVGVVAGSITLAAEHYHRLPQFAPGSCQAYYASLGLETR